MSAVDQELQRLADDRGELTPRMVLNEARDPRSPLHPYFEWDDSVAAERHRLDQAQRLIIRCRVTVITPAERTISLRKYTALPTDAGGNHPHRYVPTESAILENRDAVLCQARQDLARLRAKYQALVDFDQLLRDELAQRGEGAA